MPTIADKFFITQRLSDVAQASQLANQNTLEKMARQQRADEDNALYRSQVARGAQQEIAGQPSTLKQMATSQVGEAAGGLEGLPSRLGDGWNGGFDDANTTWHQGNQRGCRGNGSRK